MTSEIRPGDVFVQAVGMYVDYEPDARGDSTIERWAFSTNDEDSGHDGDGRLEIRVSEIIETKKSGLIVVYHRRWFAPDDTPLGPPRRNISGIPSLRALISRRNMARLEQGVPA